MELDYGGLHVRMLYHKAGTDYPLDADPYAAALETTGLDADEVFRDDPSIRADLKRMLLALICGDGTMKEAINRADHRLFRSWYDVPDGALRRQERRDCKARESRWADLGLLMLSGSNQPTSRGVMAAFEDAHQPISRYFASGCSLLLQSIDATIARDVTQGMMFGDHGKSIPCLPVHDSFISPAICEDKLRSEMRRAYGQVLRAETGRERDFQIPIKRPEPNPGREKGAEREARQGQGGRRTHITGK